MLDRDIVLQREENNDGKTIYMYFNPEVGFYTAYGPSAYYLTHVIDPIKAFSLELNLPVVLINKKEVLELRQSLKKLEHTEHVFYHFETRGVLGLAGYDKWINTITQK